MNPKAETKQPDISPAMKEALGRLATHKVWADGRSVRALIKRGLCERRGSGTDAMIGAWHCDVLTDAGRALAEKLGLEVSAPLRTRVEILGERGQ